MRLGFSMKKRLRVPTRPKAVRLGHLDCWPTETDCTGKEGKIGRTADLGPGHPPDA